MLKICIYIGINAHVTPAHRHTHGNVKVEQYSAEAESAIGCHQRNQHRHHPEFSVKWVQHKIQADHIFHPQLVDQPDTTLRSKWSRILN